MAPRIVIAGIVGGLVILGLKQQLIKFACILG
jgi:hypothetical protein